MEQTNDYKLLRQNIATNILLSVFKFIAGFLGHSAALISDGAHSLSDVLATGVVIVGLKISGKGADESHRYGHERFECIASIILTAILAITGVVIGKAGIAAIVSRSYLDASDIGYIAMIAAAVSIIVKEVMFQMTIRLYRKTGLTSIKADAWHNRADALSSVGALIGVVLVKCGIYIADPIASIVICLFVLKVALEVFVDAVDKLTDKSCGTEVERQMAETALCVAGVENIDDIRTRQFGNRWYVDVEIAVDGNISLIAAHKIADSVKFRIEKTYPEVKQCLVHVNPYA